ncbi:MAG TPA: RNA repair transcriptional activator RtcR family protein, partial [Oligoflexia bacterium]|nr:RNA repair transcriptional activator RtcR family protein [Oligoflexia bacterium]
MKILLTFTGYHDPFAPGLVGDEKTPGPILTLAGVIGFDAIVLFSTPNTESHTRQTQEALAARVPAAKVQVMDLPLSDPTDYGSILAALRAHFKNLSLAEPKASFFIGLSSGTPQMHVCWMLLAASGEIPARLLMTRPPRFVTANAPLVKEIDVSSPEFPRIRSGVWTKEEPDLLQDDVGVVLAELGIVGAHSSMQKAIGAASILATVDIPVLIQGESGTGKELFSRLIHRLSKRKNGPFVAINCANLSRELAESLLFGHAKGAFTGAVSDQPGKFELADGGTLFLDELAELPPEVQAKLLRVLEDHIVERLGGRTGKKVDVRIIAATNKDLQQAVSDGKFRADLF